MYPMSDTLALGAGPAVAGHRPPPRPRLPALAALVSAALRAQRAVELRYAGTWRVVHPHALGRTRRGNLALLAWQTAGGTGRAEGWRLFDLSRIEAVEPLRASFAPRPRTPRTEATGRWTPAILRPLEAV